MKREDIKEAAVNYDSRLVAFRAFMKGAEWRINSVWHDAKECPERKRNYLAQCKNGRFNVIPDSMNWDNFYKKAEIIRWAYIEDLLPNMED